MSLILPTFDKRIKPPLGTPLNPHLSINRGLFGFWPMNEGGGNIVRDVSGRGNTGTIVGASWGANCLSFDQDADRVIAPVQLDPDAGTVVVRWQPNWSDADVDGLYLYLWDMYGGANRRFAFLRNSTRFELITNSSSRGYVSVSITAGQWYTFALVWGRNDLYVNGVYVDTFNDGGLGSGADDIYIGDRYASTPRGLDGQVDFFRIYNRILTPSEIASLYADPWQGFRRSPIELWSATSGGVASQLTATLSESVTASDAINGLLFQAILTSAVGDTATVSDSAAGSTATNALFGSVADGVTVADAINGLLSQPILTAAVSDAASVSDDLDAVLFQPILTAAVSDGASVSDDLDAVVFQPILAASVSDTVAVADDLTALRVGADVLVASLSDTAVCGDSLTQYITPLTASLGDIVIASDMATGLLTPLVASIGDSINIEDAALGAMAGRAAAVAFFVIKQRL